MSTDGTRNLYALHTRTLFAVLFMKAPGSATGHRTTITIPRACQAKPEVDYEVELAVIIGRAAKNVSTAEALEYVMGYTVANDVSARRWQGKKGACLVNAGAGTAAQVLACSRAALTQYHFHHVHRRGAVGVCQVL